MRLPLILLATLLLSVVILTTAKPKGKQIITTRITTKTMTFWDGDADHDAPPDPKPVPEKPAKEVIKPPKGKPGDPSKADASLPKTLQAASVPGESESSVAAEEKQHKAKEHVSADPHDDVPAEKDNLDMGKGSKPEKAPAKAPPSPPIEKDDDADEEGEKDHEVQNAPPLPVTTTTRTHAGKTTTVTRHGSDQVRMVGERAAPKPKKAANAPNAPNDAEDSEDSEDSETTDAGQPNNNKHNEESSEESSGKHSCPLSGQDKTSLRLNRLEKLAKKVKRSLMGCDSQQ